MNKEQAINVLKENFMNMLADDIISDNEIEILQDWLDENGVLFIGGDYNKIILRLQRFLDDGRYTRQEIRETLQLLNEF